jgi:hypothetical protein
VSGISRSGLFVDWIDVPRERVQWHDIEAVLHAGGELLTDQGTFKSEK